MSTWFGSLLLCVVGRPVNLSGMTRWCEAVLWATALMSGLTSGESAVRLVVGRVPARCGCGEEVTFGDRFVVDGLVRRGVPYIRLNLNLFPKPYSRPAESLGVGVASGGRSDRLQIIYGRVPSCRVGCF